MKEEFKTLEVEVKKLDKGESFIGKLTDKTSREITDQETGEIKTVPQYHFTGDNKELFVFLGDRGFVNEMSLCNIKVGNRIKVTKGEQLELTNGRKVNQYIIGVASLQ